MSKEQAKTSFQKAEKSSYPKSKDVYKFDKELSRYAFWLQEFELRKELSDAATDSEILKKIGLDEFLSDEIKKEFISELAFILRYKRLNDIIYDAANRQVKNREEISKKTLTKAQMDTIIRYSLDTPHILYHILKNNSFTDQYTPDEEDPNKRQNFKTNKKRILIGEVLKSKRLFGANRSAGANIYLDENGRFVSGGETYTPLGMGSSGLRKGVFSNLDKANEFALVPPGITADTQTGIVKKMKDEDKQNMLGSTWWNWLLATVGLGDKLSNDKHGLPEWSVDGYLLKFITTKEIASKLHNEAIIYFRKQTSDDKESLKVSYSIFCQNKSVPNRKSIQEVSKELLSKGGTQKLRQNKGNAKTMRRNNY
jgi:hypothetical protein